jgi:hypothetical protein
MAHIEQLRRVGDEGRLLAVLDELEVAEPEHELRCVDLLARVLNDDVGRPGSQRSALGPQVEERREGVALQPRVRQLAHLRDIEEGRQQVDERCELAHDLAGRHPGAGDDQRNPS